MQTATLTAALFATQLVTGFVTWSVTSWFPAVAQTTLGCALVLVEGEPPAKLHAYVAEVELGVNVTADPAMAGFGAYVKAVS